MEANAALRNIVRRDTGEGYRGMLARLAQESGIETPTAEDLARLDRKRKGKKLSNQDWVSKSDPEAKIAKMKDGTTHLAYKPEHAVHRAVDMHTRWVNRLKPGCLRVVFDRRLKLEFHGSKITSDAGLLAYRELDDALGLTEMAEGVFHDSRTGKNGWHGMSGQFRQSVFGRLGGYDDVNDADRLGRDPAMRWIVGGKAIERQAASTSQMGRFETELLATDANVEALVDMNGVWIDKVHDRHPPKMIILDMDSSVSPTHGEQEGTAYNGHFGCTC